MRPRNPQRFARRRFLAFAGIGHPEKFYDTVAKSGGTVVLARSFPDHHVYAADELADLAHTARTVGLELVTTSKDAARLRTDKTAPEFLAALNVLEIDMVFDNPNAARRIVEETLTAWRQRRLAG